MGAPASEGGGSNERPLHDVTLTKGFWMSRYQITQEQYYSVMGGTIPVWFKTHGSRLPVDEVTWYEAIVFCNRLSIKEGLTPVYSISGNTNPKDWGTVPTSSPSAWDAVVMVQGANGYRLPTEAEWEYACRAGTASAYNFFDKTTGTWGTDTISLNQANHDSAYPPGTTTVGAFHPNAWGLYDMHGNVWEWCWDWYGNNYYGVPVASNPDPKGPDFPDNPLTPTRVIRGGCWGNIAQELRSAYRNSFLPSIGGVNVGIRVVRQ